MLGCNCGSIYTAGLPGTDCSDCGSTAIEIIDGTVPCILSMVQPRYKVAVANFFSLCSSGHKLSEQI